MEIKLLGPEKETVKEFKKYRLETYEPYDVLAFLVSHHGLLEVAGALNNYLTDQAETIFSKLDFEEGGSALVGLSAARALDVCAASVESLSYFAEKYEL